jgi:hypothetical protein
MPRRELRNGKQVADWLYELGSKLKQPGRMTLIGSAALLWHAHNRGIGVELPEASMNVDPITDSDEVATHGYEALIGSEFERIHGWHVNLMPESVLRELRQDGELAQPRSKSTSCILLCPPLPICWLPNSVAMNHEIVPMPIG